MDSQLKSYGSHTLRRVLSLDADHEPQEVQVWISPNDKGALTVGYDWASTRSGFSTDGAALASLLPGANPEDGRSAIDEVRGNNLPDAVAARMLAWLREQAAARLGKQSQP
ncbi:MAG: hypothetical protein DME25_20500 [Verrucomicrobia bacterium]|nr:MAG: hypothetical protein DME25_20500 [Verrucomicrobiota bacterium]